MNILKSHELFMMNILLFIKHHPSRKAEKCEIFLLQKILCGSLQSLLDAKDASHESVPLVKVT